MATVKNTNLETIARLALINNNATRVRRNERRVLEKQRTMLQALVGNGLFHDKQKRTTTRASKRVAQQPSKRVSKKTLKKASKKAPKIHLKCKTQIKRFALLANGKKVERWYTADAGWALVIDLTGEEGDKGTADGKDTK